MNDSENFNEGGADCPPKEVFLAFGSRFGWHFNEGGADCPPKEAS